MKKVFIVGSAGTTGLRLQQRLSQRSDVELLEVSPELRKENSEILRIMQQADFCFLCLPDGAALELAALAQDYTVRIIDTSTAHRCSPNWVYGFPELSDRQRSDIQSARRLCSPGCHASGFIALVYPLIAAGALDRSCLLSCTSITGYSGGGKQMIAEYEASEKSSLLKSPKPYALGQSHKHIPEIMQQCSLLNQPIFMPVVGDYYSGMLVNIPLHGDMLAKAMTADDLRQLYKAHYTTSGLISVSDKPADFLFAGELSGQDNMRICVSGSSERLVLSCLFDNLGKGASGAAIQCFNLMCGLPEETGLCIGKAEAEQHKI